MITKITPTEPACYGLVCPHHEHCARYHAAEGQPLNTLDSCQQGDERPMFVWREQLVELAAQAGQA